MVYEQEKVVSAIQAFERGEIVVVTDDSDRENEGDLVVAAVHCTEEKMAFIIRHTSGIVCAPMLKEEAQRLYLSPMVSDNNALHRTQFTVSIDFKHGVTTGISAHDRTLAVRHLADPNSRSDDFVRPGHVFPLIAHEGGILRRSGHTEAAVDLCKLADLRPVGVIAELVNDDGSVKHGDEVTEFAYKNRLHIITISDLIAYRQHREILIECVEEKHVETSVGPVTVRGYRIPWGTIQQVAIIFGDIRDGQDIPVWLHHENIMDNFLGRLSDNIAVMQRVVEKEKRGVFIYLRKGGIGFGSQSSVFSQKITEGDQENHKQAVERREAWYQIGLGMQILKHLEINSVIICSFEERHCEYLKNFGIRVSRIDPMGFA